MFGSPKTKSISNSMYNMPRRVFASKEEKREYDRQRHLKFRLNNPETYKRLTKKNNDKKKCNVNHLWKRKLQQNAERRRLNVDLDFEDFKIMIKTECYLCGKPATESEFLGIDRVNNELGYSAENSKPCCYPCNAMKEKHSLENFFELVKKIAVKNKLT